MPRRARQILPGIPTHVVARAHSRHTVFLSPHDYAEFLAMMTAAMQKHPVAIHAYVLMGNHIHLLITPQTAAQLANFMRWLGMKYVYYFNRMYERTGSLWEGRYRTSIIDSERYLMSCYRYIELNPVRAGICRLPEEYSWSSYRYNALNQQDPLVTPHEVYLGMHPDRATRGLLYSDLCREGLPIGDAVKIREGIRKGRKI